MAQVRSELMWQAVIDAVQLAGLPSGQRSGQRSGQHSGQLSGLDSSDACLDVLDLGGGTGIDAVRLASDGHRVTVVDPSPDALASLDRRASEAEVTGMVRSVLGDASDLIEHVAPGTIDLVLCHDLLEHLEDPVEALAQPARVLRSGGVLSAVVPGRYGAAMRRALAGDFSAAEDMLVKPAPQWDIRTDGPRRYTESELDDLVRGTGLAPIYTRGVRIFSDLVPDDLVNEQTRGRESLYELERLAGDMLSTIAAGIQSVARLE